MDILSAHTDLMNATHSGFAFLLVNGIGWLIAGMAALLGGHFLPYSWLYQTNLRSGDLQPDRCSLAFR